MMLGIISSCVCISPSNILLGFLVSLDMSIIHKCKTVPSKFVSSKSSCTQGMGQPSIPTRINVEQCVVLVWRAW